MKVTPLCRWCSVTMETYVRPDGASEDYCPLCFRGQVREPAAAPKPPAGVEEAVRSLVSAAYDDGDNGAEEQTPATLAAIETLNAAIARQVEASQRSYREAVIEVGHILLKEKLAGPVAFVPDDYQYVGIAIHAGTARRLQTLLENLQTWVKHGRSVRAS